MDYSNVMISTYIGRCEVNNEFLYRPEFDIHHIECSDKWNIFRQAVELASQNGDDEAIAICMGGHRFSPDYSKIKFIDYVVRSARMGTHILLGGCGSFVNLFPVKNNLYWVDRFHDSNFYVVFQSAYPIILESQLEEGETLEDVLSRTLSNKLLVSPFISTSSDEAKAKLTVYRNIVLKYHLV